MLRGLFIANQDQRGLSPAALVLATSVVLLSVATSTQGARGGGSRLGDEALSLLVAPSEAPNFISVSSSTDTILSDVRFAAQSWRWSAGTSAWIAVLVRVDSLKTIGLTRIGGLYGP